MTTRRSGRRALLTGLGAVAGATLAPRTTHAQGAGKFAPARHEQDAWMDALPGKHRVIIDVVEARGVTFGLAYANNILNASVSGYGLTDADTAIIVCLRHNATIMAFDDTIWAPNGKVLADSAAYVNPRNADTPTANPSMKTIEGLAKRGVHFAVCGLSAGRLAGLIAAGNGKSQEILKDLNAHLVPNGHMAPAGVIATTRAQEYGFSLISVA